VLAVRKLDKLYQMNNSILKKATFSFLILLCCQISYSQQKSRIFEKFDVDNGLLSNWVKDIAQDKQGYIWLATSDGLNRFDGYSMKTYQNIEGNPKSILINYVRCVFVDTDNFLWVGYNGGISKYDADKDEFSHFINNSNNANSLSSDKISDITCDTKGNLWIATRDKGICNLDKTTYNFKSYRNTENEQVNYQGTLHCDKKDRLWIGTYNAGISLFDVISKKYVSFGTAGNGLEGMCIMSIYEDKDGKIWVGTAGNGLYFFDEKANKFVLNTAFPKDKILVAICQDSKGDLWVSAENYGIYILDQKTNTTTNLLHNKYISNSLAHNSINTIIKDMNDNIWLGTFAAGVNLYKAQNNRFGHIFNDPLNPNTLNHNAVLCFAEDSDKNLWIGTDDGGVNKYNSTTNKFEFFTKNNQPNSLKSNVILSVYEDKKKNIWLGTYLEGIHLMNRKNGTFKRNLQGYSFGSILEDSEDNLWLGGWRDGLFLYNRDNDTYKSFQQKDNDPTSLSDNFVYYVYEDRNNNLWVCTSVGLNRMEDKKNGKFRRFMNDPGNLNSLANNTVYHCYEDSKGRFWVGTAGGLCQMNRDSINFTTYKVKDGLANNNVLGILEAKDGNLWLSTNKGLSCFNPETKVFKNYNKSDGLQSDQFSVKAQYKLSTGELLFGGTNGYNRFNPADITVNKNVPIIVIKDVQVFDKEKSGKEGYENDVVSSNKEIVLKSSQSNLIFDFVAFNYTNTKKVKYAYMLEGFDMEWKYTDQPAPVNYTNLDPGTYSFKVKAANEDGIWNEEGKQITVIIKPPFWASWWFRMVVLGFIVFIAYYYYRKNILNILKNHKVIEGKMKEQINALTMKLDSKKE
jgi:ligand-binding sensor domain-containing protein